MTRSDFDDGEPRSDAESAHTQGRPEDSGRWLRALVENSSEIVTVVDPDGTLRYASPAFGRALGYDPGEAVGTMNVLDHVHLDDLPLILEETEKALSEGGVATNKAEYRFRHRDGSWRWMESVGTYLLDDPAVGGVVVTSRDVTERREAEEALSRSEAEIFDVLESITDAFFALDREWRFSYVNSQAEALFGGSREDLIGERVREDSAFYPQYRNAVAEGVTARFEAYHAPLRAWYSVRAYPSESGLSVYLQDVTERKEAEERLEAQYKNFPLPTYTWQRAGEDFVLVDYNDAAHEYSHGLAGDLLGSRATELFDDLPDYIELMESCLRERSTLRRQLPWRLLRSGETRRFVVTCVFVSPDLVMIHTEDVTERLAAEKKLRFQAQLLDVAGEAVIALDDDGRVLYWNRAAEGLYGWPSEEVMGRNLREMVVPEELVGRAAAITEEVKRGGSWTGEFEVRRSDGTLFPVEGTNVPIYDDDGGLIGVIGVIRDITQRKEAEERQRETEERYRTLVERIPAVTYVQQARAPGAVTFVSPQMRDLLGYSPEECTSEPGFWLKILHPDDRERVLAEAERTDRTGEPFEMEYRQIAKDGSLVWVRDEATLVRGEGGEPLYWLGVLTDVTERKEAEEALRESEERYRSQSRELALLHRVRSALAHEPSAPSVLYMAVETVAEAYGYTQVSAYLLEGEELVLQHQVGYRQILERIPLSQGISGRAVRTRRPVLVEDVSADPDFAGTIEGVTSEICVPLLDGEMPLGFINVESRGGIKLTEDDLRLMTAVGEHTGVAVSRALLHERVLRSEKRYRALTQNSSDLVTLIGVTGVIRYQSPAIERMLGYSPEELLGKNGFDLVHPDDLPRVETAFAEGLKLPERLQSVEYRFRHKDGSWRWLETVGTNLLEDPAVGGYVLNSRDVTGRKEAEGAQARLAAIVESTDHAVMSMTLEGIFTSWNPGAERLFGYSAQEMVGHHVSVVIPPERRGEVSEATEKVKRGERVEHLETVRVTKGGRRVEISLGVSPIYGGSGEVVGASAIARDITQRKETEERLREAEERYRTLVERIPAITFVDRADGSGEPLYISPQVESMLGYTPEEWTTGRLWRERLHPEDRERVLASDERFEAHGGPVDEEYRLYARDGSVVWVREETVLVRGEGGEPLFVQGIMTDITERREAEAALRESEQRFRRSFDDAAVGMALVATDGRWLRVNRSLCDIVGYPQAELLDKTFQSITHPDDLEEDLEHARRLLAGEVRTYEMEKRYLHKKGHVVWTLLSASVVHDEGGRPLYFVSQIQDITGRKRMEDQLKRQALHDPLTGLPNRKLFVDRLGHALERTRRRKGRQVAVLFLDLDGFKVVNDSLGHEAGDLLLMIVTERLRRCVRPEDMLARFGGDEFVVLLDDVGDPSQAIRVAERITEELIKPFVLDGRGLFTSASIGIAQGDARTSTADDLLRDADTAMYRAKDEHADYRVFDLTMYERAVERLDTENDLRRAMGAGEFVVHYQPIVNLKNGETWGVEALVRWNHPERGLLDPHEFVPVAEESGLVVPMGEALMEEACRRARQWREEHPQIPPFVLSVNLSARQLVRPDLAETVGGVLERTGFEGSSLSLDITETAYVRELEDNTTSLERLRDLGVGISIDDFGTGYSSLAYLKRLPADVLKLDRSFVKGLGLQAEDTAIARTIVDLAHIMGMKVVAEGVETLEQAVLLREMGCDYAQGYYFCRPLPSGEAAQFLAG